MCVFKFTLTKPETYVQLLFLVLSSLLAFLVISFDLRFEENVGTSNSDLYQPT